jgi:hypothetical protein
MEWEAVGAFRDRIEEVAAEIPANIENPVVLHNRLAEKVHDVIQRWEQDNKSLSQRVRDLLLGDADEFAKLLEKLTEKRLAESPVASGTAGGIVGNLLGGGITSHTLIGAGAGFAISLLVRNAKNITVSRKRRREDPMRYLTMMEKAGVSYVLSN